MQERINKIRAVSESTAELLQAAYNKLLEKKEHAKLGNMSDVKEYQKEDAAFTKLLRSYEESFGIDKFESISEVYEYLIDCGYKVASRTLYDHKKKGYLTGSNGKYSLAEVEDYASKYLNKETINADDFDGLSLVDKKNLAEIELKNLRAEREQIAIDEARGRLISRDIVDREFASRIEVIKRLLQEQEESLPVLLAGKSESEIRDIIAGSYKYIMESYSRELFKVNNISDE
ncbi:MAG: hypothetical protein MSA07_03480 [Mucispirillum sp.]|nr:hypothetical protein [Mucispirillum sp.]